MASAKNEIKATCSSSQSDSHKFGKFGQPFSLDKLGYQSIGIQTNVVTAKAMPNYIKTIGKIESVPSRQFFIHSVATGHITKVDVVLGQNVNAQDTLIEYESPDINELSSSLILNKQGIEAQISQLETSFQDEIKEANSQVELARQNYERDDLLFKEKIGSLKALQTSKAYLDISLSKYKVAITKRDLTLAAMRKKLELTLEPIKQKLKLMGASDEIINNILKTQDPITKIELKSPATGDIIFQNATCGQSISPGVRLFTICNEAKVWASANINESDISRIKIGDGTELVVKAYPSKIFKGKIVYMNHDLDPQSRTLSVRALIENTGEILKPEMFANLKIYTDKPIYRLMVPTDAVVERNSHSYAFIFNPPDSFQPVLVKTGIAYDDSIEVVSGIESGQNIVTKGAFQLLAHVLKTQGQSDLFKQPTEGDRAYDKDEIEDGSQKNNSFNLMSILLYVICLVLGVLIGVFLVLARLNNTSKPISQFENLKESQNNLNNK